MPKKKPIPEIVVQVSPRRFVVCGAPVVVNGVAYYEKITDETHLTLLDAVAAAHAWSKEVRKAEAAEIQEDRKETP